MMIALASAGTGTFRSTANVILALVPCDLIAVMVPTLTPATRTSSPG